VQRDRTKVQILSRHSKGYGILLDAARLLNGRHPIIFIETYMNRKALWVNSKRNHEVPGDGISLRSR
jgi:hypothetical protein